ncbi:MAG: SDR family NAD(P)-dependent oxidoreductase [Chloroflexaceae bacterium]|nr:SDR family NAD(P)-dependent oxidoreductase [Chloroflexaceae bacterium]NJL33860.1 SDR family NAD(P)-dependent oxidoreductase [Chloroflexaceae bacterium]NJO04613.1 SDR family NAD(P)-dependent oxidoreductase [Chloroflexaceae bacterium]
MILAEKVALVTGGTGGLGGAVVAALLREGAAVALPYQHTGEIERLRERLKLDADAPISGAQVELTDERAVEAYYRQVADQHGGLDILINIAGGFGGGQPVHETPWSLWQQQLDLNLKTAVLSSHYGALHMLNRGGAIVNVSTRTAVQSGKHLAAYAASKRAVLQLTEAMAAELLEHNVTVNAILPSVIDTPGNRSAMPNADFDRWVKPAEIAEVILFLVGPHARVISGVAIPVYGKA